MKKIFYIFILTGLISVTQAFGQRQMMGFEYSMGFGSGDMKDYVDAASFRGFAFEYHSFVQPQIAVGFETGLNVFYESRAYDTYTYNNFSISGKQWRYIHAVPIIAAADYYFSKGNPVNPFIGVGIGTIYNRRDLDMSVYTFYTDAWQFAIRPELGVNINASPNMDIRLVGKYFGAFKTSDMDAQTYFTFNIGFVQKL